MIKEYIFWLQTAEKVSTTLINLTRNIKSYLTSPLKGPTSPARENIFPVREQCKSPMRELSHSPVREDQSPVKVTSKTGKKRQGESQKKRQMTHGHDSEFQRESQSVQSLNFDKVQKIDNQC